MAIVVSETSDKLSPNIAPLSTAATAISTGNPVVFAKLTATGTNETKVPTEVPIAIEIKHAIKNIPTKKTLGGKIARP
jgi:hypothetical protein